MKTNQRTNETKDASTKETKGQKRYNKNKREQKRNYRKDSGSDTNVANLSTADRDNDPNWYFTSKDVADQTSSYAFDRFLGVADDLSVLNSAGAEYAMHQTVPTIMAVSLNPCPGDTSTIKSGINMAALKMYTTLSSNNAKTTNYAPQDLTMLMLSLGEIISMLEHIRRAFGVAFTYNQRNRALPSKLLDAMGFDADDFLTDIAQHRMQFNTWITSVNKIPFLSNVAYFYKCADLYQKIYTDSTSEMAQIMFCKPHSTWSLNEEYNDQGSGLVTEVLPTYAKWSSIVTLMNKMITALFESSTFNFIYADVLNYASKTGAKMLYLDYLVEGYTVIPEYNRNFLLQIHNSNAVGSPAAIAPSTKFTKGNDVACNVNTNKVEYVPAFPTSGVLLPQELIVDMDTPTPSLEDRIEATRFQSILGDVTAVSSANYGQLVSMADHYVVRYTIDTVDSTYSISNSVHMLVDTSVANMAKDVIGILHLSQFDWHPIIHVMQNSAPTDGIYTVGVLGDLNYYTTLDVAWYEKVNDLTFLALFELR